MADPTKQFEIEPIIPIELAGYDISFTNSSLWMIIGIVVSFLLIAISGRKRALVPGRFQNLGEITYEFIADMIEQTVGERGRPYFPFIFTIFMVVLMGNLLGIIPYSFTYTSHLIVTFALAAAVLVVITMIGVVLHGLHFFTLFLPHGVPLWLAPLMIPIEIISYLFRPVSLSVRLFANMTAGHLLLKAIAGFCVALAGVGTLGMFGTALPTILNVAIIAFEVVVALIQAYIFTILSCIYLRDAVELH
jgi:F-type H+-transporting ATPase subunit a